MQQGATPSAKCILAMNFIQSPQLPLFLPLARVLSNPIMVFSMVEGGAIAWNISILENHTFSGISVCRPQRSVVVDAISSPIFHCGHVQIGHTHWNFLKFTWIKIHLSGFHIIAIIYTHNEIRDENVMNNSWIIEVAAFAEFSCVLFLIQLNSYEEFWESFIQRFLMLQWLRKIELEI